MPPKVAINYYNRVVATVGERATRENMRFFMVPGMGHGPGTTGVLARYKGSGDTENPASYECHSR